jgi:hypothetical protein
MLRTGLTILWWGVVPLLALYTWLAIERRITWYLAVDQFGYMTFAHDLLHGRVFHDWPPLQALRPLLAPRTDVLAQTYVWDQGRLYCRYAPGFPIILALWLALLGDDWAHYLNPVLFIGLLIAVVAFQRRVFHSRWRALSGGALLLLFPTLIHLWGLTLTRDLSCHLMALMGLFVLLPWRAQRLGPRRAAMAGFLLGFTASIRPDAAMYLLPASLIAWRRWRHERLPGSRPWRPLGAAGGAFAIGLLPFLTYNGIATGNPLRPTQSMELNLLLTGTPAHDQPVQLALSDAPGLRVGYPSPGWHGGTITQVQGGGLRLRNLPRTLPQQLSLLRDAYGDVFLAVAVWGALLALWLRPLVFLASVPYIVVSLLFYSCWERPDTRYLVGAHIYMLLLVVHGLTGTLDAVRRLARHHSQTARALGGLFAVFLVAGAALVENRAPGSAQGTIDWLVPAIVAPGAVLAAVWPRRRVVGILAPVLALALAGYSISRSNASLTNRASFQRPEVLEARATLARSVPRGAVVLTTEDVGRPAENIEYYSDGIHALYTTDLMRWRVELPAVARALADAGMPLYTLLPPGWENGIRGHRFVTFEPVAQVPPAKAYTYFVAAAFHRGVPLSLQRVRVPPAPQRD